MMLVPVGLVIREPEVGTTGTQFFGCCGCMCLSVSGLATSGFSQIGELWRGELALLRNRRDAVISY